MTTENQIVHFASDDFWVFRERIGYHVMRPYPSGNLSQIDSTYAPDADGLSIAIARCDYLANRAAKGN